MCYLTNDVEFFLYQYESRIERKSLRRLRHVQIDPYVDVHKYEKYFISGKTLTLSINNLENSGFRDFSKKANPIGLALSNY